MSPLSAARPTLNILLVDDDLVFAQIMQQSARRAGAVLHHCASIGDLARMRHVESYDVALIDYNLGAVDGTSVATFLNLFFGAVPVAIVSSSSQWWFETGASYPACVRKFIHKAHSHAEIIRLAADVANVSSRDDESDLDYEAFARTEAGTAGVTRAYRGAMAAIGNGLLAGIGYFHA